MRIPEEHKKTIAALVKADPEVMQATCDIPHEDPTNYLRNTHSWEEGALPYCGCFVGVYSWMHACKRGETVSLPTPWITIPEAVSRDTGILFDSIEGFGLWCKTVERDQAAVRYARGLLL